MADKNTMSGLVAARRVSSAPSDRVLVGQELGSRSVSWHFRTDVRGLNSVSPPLVNTPGWLKFPTHTQSYTPPVAFTLYEHCCTTFSNVSRISNQVHKLSDFAFAESVASSSGYRRVSYVGKRNSKKGAASEELES